MKSTQLSLKVDGIGLLVTHLWGFQEGGKGHQEVLRKRLQFIWGWQLYMTFKRDSEEEEYSSEAITWKKTWEWEVIDNVQRKLTIAIMLKGGT